MKIKPARAATGRQAQMGWPYHRAAALAYFQSVIFYGKLRRRPLSGVRDEPEFQRDHNIPPEVMALLVGDDEALLDFGLNFIKHVLFGENFIEDYPDAYEKRLARKREHSEPVQQAAFGAKMALEDDKYSSDH